MKTRCELCKCLNLIAEAKRHPSNATWLMLTHKFDRIRRRDPQAIGTFCDNHRLPLNLVVDAKSVSDFIVEVQGSVTKMVEASLREKMQHDKRKSQGRLRGGVEGAYQRDI